MARTSTVQPELADRFHRDGCPAERVEAYTEQRPRGRGSVRVVRCVDCGGQDVIANGASTPSLEETDEGDDI